MTVALASEEIVISTQDVLHQIKLSNRLPLLIDEIARQRIIKSTAEAVGIQISTEELQKTADYLRLSNGLTSSDDTWKWLNHHGITLDDFEEAIYSSVLALKVASHFFADQVEPFFYEHQLNYSSVSFHEIILEDEDLAMELFFSLTEGESSFPEMAQQYIQDTELRRCGGYRGKVPRQSLKPEVAAAIYASKPPQLLKPILTAKGVHLIFVDEIIHPQLDDKLREKILLDLFMQWLQQKTSEIRVVKHLD
jgi:parvulin-like peptidyl-prolyl isomerase